MATADLLTTAGGHTLPQFQTIYNSSYLRRNKYNESNVFVGEQACLSKGYGYTFDGGNCYFPCPDSYTILGDDKSKCEPRPLLSKLDEYYGILNQAVRDCATLIPAYKEAVKEAGNDPTQVGFPADLGCENPYASIPSNPTGDEGVFDPSASNGDPLKPKDAPTDQAFIPSPPEKSKYVDEYDASGFSKVLPRNRLIVTDEEIDRLPKVNDFGTMTDGDLAMKLRENPSYLDTHPNMIAEFMEGNPDFIWECTVTQQEFDLLPDGLKCNLCENYDDYIYRNPEGINYLRGYAPTITITRTAPSTAPSFQNCPEQVKKIACESQYVEIETDEDIIENLFGFGGLFGGIKKKTKVYCTYSGGCQGTCDCPQQEETAPQKPADTTSPTIDIPTSSEEEYVDNSARNFVIVSGVVLLLAGGYYIYKS